MFARRRTNRSLKIESLEIREMKAGDIAASVVNGSLYLSEAAGQAGKDNAVQISQLSNGKIHIAGTSTSDGSVSHINGAASQDFTVTGGLFVNFGGGNDLVVIGSEVGGIAPTFSTVDIEVGTPPPLLSPMVNTTGGTTIFNAPDKDNVIIWNMNTRGAVTINTGADADWVYVSGLTMTSGDLSINTGAGADTVEIEGITSILPGAINIQTYSSLSETDDDTVWFDGAYSKGNMQVLTGGGNDLFHMANSSTLGSLYFDAGAGNDTFNIDHVDVVDSLMAHLGEGNDTMTIDYLWGNDFHFLGEGGTDSLQKTANVFGHSLEQTGWEYINGRLQITTVLGTTSTQKAI